jgi:GT2 family glycosyltransferase
LVGGIVSRGFDVCHSNMLLPRNGEFRNIYTKESPKNIYYYELNKYGYVEQIIRDHDSSIIKTRFLSGACFIIKRSVIENLGYLFDEDFGSYNEDMDLGLRLLNNGFKTGVVPSSVVYHLSSFSFSLSTYNIWKNLVIIRNRFIVFWKSSSSREFLCFLPRLIVSQSHKVFRRSVELKNGSAKSFILACSVMPLSLISFLWFIVFVLRRGRLITENGFKTAPR